MDAMLRQILPSQSFASSPYDLVKLNGNCLCFYSDVTDVTVAGLMSENKHGHIPLLALVLELGFGIGFKMLKTELRSQCSS